MDFKLVGSILLIVGTAIGAGMLALPIATAELGFFGALIMLVVCWVVMTAGALLLLEVNLWLPRNNNIITMAKATIGPIGQILAWLSYLLLLYSILCAYIGGGSDLFYNLLSVGGIDIPRWEASIIFTVIFSSVVFLGIRAVDYTNRAFMAVKLGAYVLLVALLMHCITLENMTAGSLLHLTSATALTVTITSFGYSPIIPSLCVYFGGDIKRLKKAIFIGSLIPLICYIAWDAVIMGIIPLDGSHGLGAILHSQNSTSDLVNSLSTTVSNGAVTFCVRLFTSICVVTSFLAVGLCLSDFMSDGLQVEKTGLNSLLVHAITFVPPLVVVLFFPNIFVRALEYAGIYCVILMLIIPAWMVWRGRYHKKIAHGYRVFGGKTLLIFVFLFSIFVIVRQFTPIVLSLFGIES